MPLARRGVHVSHFLEPLGKGPQVRAQGQAGRVLALHQPRDSRDVRVQAGHHRPTPWTAQRRGGVAVREAHAVSCHSIQVWRARNRVPVTAEIVPAVVVSDNYQEVWLPLLRPQRDSRQACQQAAPRHVQAVRLRRIGAGSLAWSSLLLVHGSVGSNACRSATRPSAVAW